ncbi:hypothetical protein [Oscillibacter sp.]|uniref:hypothetical protein n=1 Tax=Oscillibacter sp. TaxID=1945593 RepID=UPI0028ADC353|nr:hypothetical protein [Oscillibacter sp.]
MEQLIEIISSLFASFWGLFTGVQVPGLGISFASWTIALVLAGLSIRLVSYVFGFGGSGTGYRSGQSRNKHISDNRKSDEK